MVHIRTEFVRALAEAIGVVAERFVDKDGLPIGHIKFSAMETLARSNTAALDALEFVAKEKVHVIPTPEWEPMSET